MDRLAQPNDTPHPDGFQIKTIEGFGPNKDYWRIANNLVRGSRIYKKLTLKIYRISRVKSQYRKTRLKYEGLYRELLKEFKAYEKDVDKEYRKQAREVDKLKREILRYKATIKRLTERDKYKNRIHRADLIRNRALEAKLSKVRSVEVFLTRKLEWGNGDYTYKRAELMLRSLFAFRDAEAKGEITFTETVYLAVGTQLDAFSKEHIQERFGPEVVKWFGRDTKRLIEKGYIRRFERKALFYITLEGREKIMSVMRAAYSKSFNPYWEGIFTDKK